MKLTKGIAAFAAAVAVAAFAAQDAGRATELALGEYLAFGQLTKDYYEAIVKHAGLQVIHADGAVTLRLQEIGREVATTPVSSSTTIRLKDEYYPLEVTRHVKTWNDCAAVETWVEIRHAETGPIKLIRADSIATPVAASTNAVRVLSLTGRAKNEANVSESRVVKGQTVELISSAGTRDAWEANAAMMVLFGEDVDEERGAVLGVALEWAGTSCSRVRRNWDGKRTEVFAGVDMTTGPYTLDPGVTFTTPKAILVWSEKGKGEVSREYHRWARRHLMPHGDALHPVLLNSWEGSYFSFTEQTLLDMMAGVKEMGGEMFVLDDGWFGRGRYARDETNRATAGLGDWCVNTAKLPHGLGWLAEEAAKRGLQFGLWVEPEMANTNSWLTQEHPDWFLQEKGRPVVCGRGKTQVVLDLTNPAVRDNLFTQLDAVYSAIPSLAYVKWDCNASIHNPGSTYLAPDRQPNLWYDYTQGYNELLARFQAKRPQIMVQACASGGGRMDFGSLRYTDEFWASDCTDPYRRIFIQWGASQFYPASAMACHVTASPNHQTKRVTPLKYRFDVAMTGRLGFELHPKDLSAEEVAFAKAAVADYKRIRPIVQRGDLYRLVSPYEKPFSSLLYVSESKDSAAVFALGLKIDGERVEVLKLRGLNPDASYSVQEINCIPGRHHAKLPAAISGRDLMEKGITVRLSGDYDSAVFEVAATAR
ncbi:MAG: alpha-galactosidase [Kiritimatiellae bacterium]|nr:alpha-galactosidase [Kiritimatiellia bacterium]